MAVLGEAGVPTTAATIQQGLEQYFTARCNSSQIINQTVYIPKVVLQGPNCTNEDIVAVNQLTQSAACVLPSISQLLELAGLGPPVPVPGHLPPYTPVIVSTQVIVALVVAALLVLVIFVAGGMGIRQARNRA